jgi:hypothetical protein
MSRIYCNPYDEQTQNVVYSKSHDALLQIQVQVLLVYVWAVSHTRF